MSWQGSQDSPEVALAIPHRGDVSFDWATRFASLDLPGHRICSQNTAALDLAREKTAELAMEGGAEWILFLDSDVIPPRDIFYRLKSHRLDFVSGLYYVDKDPVHPAMWRLDRNNTLSPVVRYIDNGVVEADAVGLGCTLVNRRVLEDIERPWFRWTEGYDKHPWDTSELGGALGVGEDFFFSHKAKEAGYNIYVDTSAKCNHEKMGVLHEGGFNPVSHQGGN